MGAHGLLPRGAGGVKGLMVLREKGGKGWRAWSTPGKDFIKGLAYRLINLFLRPGRAIPPRTLLLIRLDLIGDYVLFRDFIAEIRHHPAYARHRLTLLGNSAWRDLCEELDGHLLDEAVWLDRARFNRDFLYRLRMLRQITRRGYETIISPVYSRYFWDSDNLVRLISARHKIGSAGDCTNQSPRQKRRGDRYYTRLIPARPGTLFEFQRNREFCQGLLGRRLEQRRPRISLPRHESVPGLPQPYAVLFAGASQAAKKWSPAHFAQVARHLIQKHGLAVVLCGGPEDAGRAEAVRAACEGSPLNLAGRTSLPRLLRLLAGARLLVSNDTAAPHLALALGRGRVVVISGGINYGRCFPYPRKIDQGSRVICHPEIERGAAGAPGVSRRLDIDRIAPERVIAAVDEVLGA